MLNETQKRKLQGARRKGVLNKTGTQDEAHRVLDRLFATYCDGADLGIITGIEWFDTNGVNHRLSFHISDASA